MPERAAVDPLFYALAVVAGIVLVALARWASRHRDTSWEPLVTLRVGDVLLTEVAGAFLIGYGLGGLIAPAVDDGGPPGRPAAGRFGRFGGVRSVASAGLPVLLGIVGAAVAVLARIDLGALLFRGAPARNALASYVGWDARVVAPIRAGAWGEIVMHDAVGNVMSVVATADVDIAEGTRVRVTGTKGLNLVVAPLSS